jgi:mRNA interferase MazF
VKDFDKWNYIKKKTDLVSKEMIIDEGDVWWCRFGLNIGDEVLGKGDSFNRPTLIVKKFSKNVFWGVPLTLKKKNGSWYLYLKQIKRTAVLNQMRLLDKKRLEERVFSISEAQLKEVKKNISNLLLS